MDVEKQVAEHRARFQADDKLSRIVSEIVKIDRHVAEALNEIHAFHAPSECGGIVIRSAQKATQKILEREQLSAEQFEAAVSERTTDKWLYFSGLSLVMDSPAAGWSE